ncbi:MAG: porin [Wenzhouxiangella sp.]|nr:porin [Wenzhouxiangella sp.]MCH8476994.1 porin [Wenzhouxiangella sp.]
MSLRLTCGLAVASLLNVAALAHADDDEFSILLRLQPELVNVSGSAAGGQDRKGWYLTDGWGGGNKNSHNWGALFIDGGFAIGERSRIVGRLGLNIDMEGLKDGDARERELEVGVEGPWGRLMLGRLETPYKTAGLGWDPLNGSFLQARANFGRSGGAFGHGGYVDNALSYSHRLGPLRFSLFGAVDDLSDLGSGGTSGNHAWGFSVLMPAGPVELMVARIDASDFKQGPPQRTGSKLGLRWSGGPWGLATHVERRGRGLEHGDFYYLTGSYRFQQGWQMSAAVGRFSARANGRDADYAALALRYQVDRRFSFHGGVRRNDQDIAGSETLVGIGMRMIFASGNLLARKH